MPAQRRRRHSTGRVLPGQSVISAASFNIHTDFSCSRRRKGKVFPYSLPSVGLGADPGAQTVSPQVT